MFKQFKISILFCLASILAISSANAQFFATIKKPTVRPGYGLMAEVADAPVTKNEFRPIINVFSSAIQLNSKASQQASISALTGGGLSYQHLVYDAAKDRWNAQWSVNGLAWYTKNMGGDQSNVFMYGVALGLLNNNVLVGAATDGGGKFAVTAGFGINFNN